MAREHTFVIRLFRPLLLRTRILIRIFAQDFGLDGLVFFLVLDVVCISLEYI